MSFLKALIVVAVIGWVGGLFWYAEKIPSQPSTYDQKTDAIIVLTGGQRRLGHGFNLLRTKQANELLITGVGEGVKLAELLAQQDVGALEDVIDARVISLDYAAISTATNAIAADAWMRGKGFHTARLVTANYHMPRALLEFRAQLPEIEIHPEPVFPDKEFQLEQWWTDPNSIKLMNIELLKYLVTWFTVAPPSAT